MTHIYCVLGEDAAHERAIPVIIRRLLKNERLPVKKQSYGGCGRLLSDGARDMRMFHAQGCNRFIICHDSDEKAREQIINDLRTRIIRPSGLNPVHCLLVPTQEFEAWILADIAAVTSVFPGWVPTSQIRNPERISSPKEFLIRLSRKGKSSPRYDPVIHADKVAAYLDLQKVELVCPSFRPLAEFVRT